MSAKKLASKRWKKRGEVHKTKSEQVNSPIPWYPSFFSYTRHYCTLLLLLLLFLMIVDFIHLFLSFIRRRRRPSHLPHRPTLPCDARHRIRPPAVNTVLETRPAATDERCSRLKR